MSERCLAAADRMTEGMFGQNADYNVRSGLTLQSKEVLADFLGHLSDPVMVPGSCPSGGALSCGS